MEKKRKQHDFQKQGEIGLLNNQKISLLTQQLEVLKEKNNHHIVGTDSCILFTSSIDNLKNLKHFLDHIYSKYKDKKIRLHSLLHMRNDGGGHVCYADIKVNKEGAEVNIIDPAINCFIPKQLSEKNRNLFESVFGKKLKYTYHFRGDQVLNFHDCGRFSTIYLLNSLKGKDPLTLSNYEIYKGFKVLQDKGYERIHQELNGGAQKPRVQSKFSYCMGAIRGFCDFTLKKLGLDDKDKIL